MQSSQRIGASWGFYAGVRSAWQALYRPRCASLGIQAQVSGQTVHIIGPGTVEVSLVSNDPGLAFETSSGSVIEAGPVPAVPLWIRGGALVALGLLGAVRLAGRGRRSR